GVGARGDLVDHAPGIGDLALILDVVHKAGGDDAHLSPLFGVGKDAGLDLVAVVGAVVHALQGQGQGACLVALVEQGGDLAHGELCAHAALQVGGVEADRKSTRLNSSHVSISYAVFCLKKNN